MLRFAAPLLALALTIPTAAPATAAPLSDGRSTPVEDSYYPDKGDPGVDALHYGLDLTWLKDRRVLKGVARITLRATANDDHFQLDLGDPLRVSRVSVNGSRARFTHRGKTLRVQRRVVGNQRYRVRVVYAGTPRPTKAPTTRSDFSHLGWTTTRTGQVWTMQEPFGAFTWYPSNDQPSDKALYDVRISAPGRWVGVSNGALRSRRTANGRTVTRWHVDRPASTYLMTIAIGPYKRFRQAGPHGLPMSYWVPANRPGLVKPLLRTPAAMRWLERRLGRYPFDRLGVVLVPSQSAMETQEMITFGIGNYGYGNTAVQEIMLHELAHSWYGDTVTPRDWRDVWMNEGMATYFQGIWQAEEDGRTADEVMDEYAAFEMMMREESGPPAAYDPTQFGEGNIYYGPALMWHELRKQIGDELFFQVVRDWPARDPDTNAGRDEYLPWLVEHTGVDRAFFDDWLLSETTPERS